jgi:hypothetical protein
MSETTVTETVTTEPDEPEVVDTGDTIVVAGPGGDSELAMTVGRLEAENAEQARRIAELEASQVVTEAVAETALDVALSEPEPVIVEEPEPEPEPPKEDEPPSGLHPFHKPWSQLKGN